MLRALLRTLAICGALTFVAPSGKAETTFAPALRSPASPLLSQEPSIYDPAPTPGPAKALDPIQDKWSDENARLSKVRARAFLGLRDYRSARAETTLVLAANPDDVDALRTLAAIEEATGRWRHAANNWTRVERLTGDAAAGARREALVRAHPSYVGLSAFFEGSAGVDQMSGARLTYAARPIDGPEWTAILENRVAQADTAILRDGSIAAIDESRRKLDVEIADAFAAGRLGLRLIVTDDTFGGGVSFRRSRPWGALELVAVYKEPYWAYASNLKNEATHNHIDANVNVWRGRFAWRARVSLADYNVADQDSAARSTRAAAGFDYALGDPAGNPVRLNVVIDTENFFAIEERQRADRTRYTPIQTVDRAVLSLGAAKTFGDPQQRFATLALGYRRDAKNETQGPYAGVSAETPLGQRLRIGLRAEYSDVSTRGVTGEPYSFAEVYLRRTF